MFAIFVGKFIVQVFLYNTIIKTLKLNLISAIIFNYETCGLRSNAIKAMIIAAIIIAIQLL